MAVLEPGPQAPEAPAKQVSLKTVPASPAPANSAPARGWLRLAELKLGDRARVAPAHSVSRGLDPEEWALLRALGLSERRTFRVARAGGPWILQIRSTRIGLTRELAQKLWVLPRATA